MTARPKKGRVLASDKRPQIERFRETARALGADEDEAAFKAKLAVIARQKPKAKAPKAKPKRAAEKKC